MRDSATSGWYSWTVEENSFDQQLWQYQIEGRRYPHLCSAVSQPIRVVEVVIEELSRKESFSNYVHR